MDNRKILNIRWLDPPGFPALGDGDIHIWRIRLDLADRQLRNLAQNLTAEERVRAERFYFGKDSARFIAARGTLKAILGCYIEKDPREIRFIYSQRGKPSLHPAENRSGIQFNISHSGDLALIVFTRNRNIGIDLERIRSDIDIDLISGRYFSAGEAAVLRTFPYIQRMDAFFALWTCKEAFVKATGEGLSVPFDEIEMSGMIYESRLFMQQGTGKWSILSFNPGPDYAGALAVEGRPEWVQFWNAGKE
jgi:4'-phosphopantetheinyl transferase